MSDPERGPEAAADDAAPPPGRPVRLEPTPPGFWRLVLGAVIAVLAPFFGLLVGSSMGGHDTASSMGPLYWGFFIGGLIGAPALVIAGTGGMTLLRQPTATSTKEAS